MADEFRKKISKKLNMKEVNVINWLHNSQITKNQWVKAEREKIEENNTKEWTFKPIINKRSYEAEAKYSLKLRTNDKFNDLYQKAKRDKVKKKIENNKQDVESIIRKDEWTFMPKESLSKQNSKCSNSSVCDANSNINNQDSHIGSNPEITSSYKPFDTEDIEYVNKKIEEIKTSNNDFELNYENHDYSPDDDQSNSKNSLASPVRINNVLNIQNRITSETPKTEELEEEMRDQVLDYQNPIFNNCKPAETQEFEAQGNIYFINSVIKRL